MKIRHVVDLDEQDIEVLWKPVMDACLVPYSSVEEQARALASVKAEFESRLAEMLSKAVKMGKKLGKAKADEKDLEMYS